MSLSEKPKTPPKLKKFLTKTCHPRFLECAEPHVYIFPKKIVFEGVFSFFFDKVKPYFECPKVEDFRLK